MTTPPTPPTPGRPGQPGGPARPDASMTLLTEMMERPLDPSYASEAARREAAGLPPARVRPWRLALIAFLVGALLVLSAKALRQPNDAVASQRASLIEQIHTQEGAADALAARQAELRAEIGTARAQALAVEQREDLTARLAAAEIVAGTAAVRGPGIELTIDDAPRAAGGGGDGDPRGGSDQDMGTIVSRDLQIVVNGLWSAGAEAVSINGQRLTSTSAIRFAGDAILVDYRPLSRPYVVSAIGDGAAFETAFTRTEGGVYLQGLADEYGIVYERAVKDSLTCPAGTPAALRHAKPPGAATPAPSTSSQPPTDSETAP